LKNPAMALVRQGLLPSGCRTGQVACNLAVSCHGWLDFSKIL